MSGSAETSATSSNSDTAAPVGARPRKRRAETPELGKALRTVYQRTIDEAIPPEMLDLLGKLG